MHFLFICVDLHTQHINRTRVYYSNTSMISDDDLNTVVLTFGFVSVGLILIYQAISVNTKRTD